MTQPLPSLTPAALRAAFGQYATGVCVVGCETDTGERLGVTVNSFTSVSLAPALLLVCLDHGLRSHDGLTTARGLGISVLAADQQALSRRFAASNGPKWDEIDALRGDQGGLLVPGAVAHFDCAREAVHPAGDHSLLIARVLRCHIADDRRPLIFFRGRYDAIASAA